MQGGATTGVAAAADAGEGGPHPAVTGPWGGRVPGADQNPAAACCHCCVPLQRCAWRGLCHWRLPLYAGASAHVRRLHPGCQALPWLQSCPLGHAWRLRRCQPLRSPAAAELHVGPVKRTDRTILVSNQNFGQPRELSCSETHSMCARAPQAAGMRCRATAQPGSARGFPRPAPAAAVCAAAPAVAPPGQTPDRQRTNCRAYVQLAAIAIYVHSSFGQAQVLLMHWLTIAWPCSTQMLRKCIAKRPATAAKEQSGRAP